MAAAAAAALRYLSFDARSLTRSLNNRICAKRRYCYRSDVATTFQTDEGCDTDTVEIYIHPSGSMAGGRQQNVSPPTDRKQLWIMWSATGSRTAVTALTYG